MESIVGRLPLVLICGAMAGCIFIDDAEHAAFLAALDPEGEGPSDTDTGTGTDSDTGSTAFADVAALADVVVADGDIVHFGRAVAIGDVDADGDGEVLGSYLQDERPSMCVMGVDRFVAGADPAGAGRGDAWFIGMAGNVYDPVPIAVMEGSDTPILAGDPQYTRSGPSTGGVWLLARDHAGQNDDVGVVMGEAGGDLAGASIATGPGEQVAVGAPAAGCGVVYVGTWPFDPQASAQLSGDFATSTSTAGLHALGVDCSGATDGVVWSDFGRTLAIADYTGIGLLGVAVGAPSSESSGGGGAVYFVPAYGQLDDDGAGGVNLSEAGGAFVISGVNPEGRFGASLAVADLDGDGADDLIVGEPDGVGDGEYQAGAAYVFVELADMATDVQADEANVVVRGDVQGQHVGSAVAGLRTTDPRDEEAVAIGASGYDGGRGAVLIAPPWDEFASGSFSGVDGGRIYTGAAVADQLGEFLAGGDADLDGLPDLVMGTPHAGAAEEGAVWLLRGSEL